MASLDSLPADQRAVLQLVLQRGRSYEDIAGLLSIDRAAVRQRALTALNALGPNTGLPGERRAMISDYLLAQLPEDLRQQTRTRLAENAGERAWARVIASELSPMAASSLPEIPEAAEVPVAPDEGAAEGPPAGGSARPEPVGPVVAEPPAPTAGPPAPVGGHPAVPTAGPGAPVGGEPAVPTAGPSPGGPGSAGGGRSSRLGGLILIAGVVAVVVVVALILLLNSGGSSNHKAVAAQSSSTSTAPATTSSSTSTAARVVAQINLTPPKSGSKAAGIAEVLKQGANHGIAIVAQNVPPNSTKPPNAYAVWLYNSRTDSHILGFVNPGVGKDGRLSTAGGLPTNAAHFKKLIVTVETHANPRTPGTIVLQGALTGLS